MASPRPGDRNSSYDAFEDAVLSRALLISLRTPDGNPPNKDYLPDVAQEIEQERATAGDAPPGPLLLQADNLERVLMARLLSPPDPSARPWQYLLASYGRVTQEQQLLSSVRDRDFAAKLGQTLTGLKQLLVSYSGLLLNMGMFPQPAEAESMGVRQLYESLASRIAPIPSGFLEDLAARFEGDGLEDFIIPNGEAAAAALANLTLLGDFQSPLSRLSQLLSVKPIAAAITKSPRWSPARSSELAGRSVERTILGPPFCVSGLPDQASRAPSTELHRAFAANQGDAALRSSMTSLQITAAGYQSQLHQLVMLLLKPAGTREAALQWFADVLAVNEERGKLQADPAKAATDGFFLNLSAVLLRCCEPFLEPMSGKAWGKVDSRYVVHNARLDYNEQTRLNADAEEQAALRERLESGASAGAAPPAYHFICECFFLTAAGNHLGLMRVVSACYEAVQKYQHLDSHRREMEAALQHMSAVPPHVRARAEYIKGLVNTAQEEVLIYQTALSEEELLRSALAFYRLMAAWLLRVASPAVAAGHPVDLPLPTPAPADFRMLPEYFVEDIAEFLLYIGRYKPRVLEGARLEEIAMFLVVFLASPEYVRNPYLRSKLAEVLLVWMPQEEEEAFGSRRGFRGRASAASSTVANLFEGHSMVQQHMVRSLIQLYVDMEHTGRNTAFYEKFSTRHAIGQILSYLWNIPQHQEAWRALAQEQGGRGLYMRFCHHLETDSIHLLDEAMKLLPEIREAEIAMADEAAWRALPQQQQQEREHTLQQNTRSIRADLDLADMSVHVMRFSTTEITATWLLPESVARIAGMLNYFLMHLTGPGRRKLKVKDPEQYHWHPKELLAAICSIYIHLARADARGVFAAAIAADGRCYRPDMFPEAAQVLRSFMLLGEREIEELDVLAMRVAAAGASAQAAEAGDEEAPDDFWDPIMATIMDDPVTLPTSEVTVDRATIMRHLLSDPNDPFNRQPLREQDLVPNVELKQRIDKWRGARQGQP